jgi:hypothetical protein
MPVTNVETGTTGETQVWLFQLQCTFHPSKGNPQEGFGAFAGVQEELKSFVVDVAQALSEVCFSVHFDPFLAHLFIIMFLSTYKDQ